MQRHLEALDATYADESFVRESGCKAPQLLVAAQVDERGDFRWLETVREKLGRRPHQEVKYADARRVYDGADESLRRAIQQGIGSATIVILDVRDRSHLPQWIRSLPKDLPVDRHTRVLRRYIERWDDELALFACPAWSIHRVVPGAGLHPDELRPRLGESHNVRLFSLRLSAAFVEYVDGNALEFVRRRAEQTRFLLRERFLREFLLDETARDRYFDHGNRVATSAIGDFRLSVHEALEQLLDEEDAPLGATRELMYTPNLEVADVAAGFARQWYERYGVRALLDHFRAVLLNGELVR